MVRILHRVEDVGWEVVQRISALDQTIKYFLNVIAAIVFLDHRFTDNYTIIDAAY